MEGGMAGWGGGGSVGRGVEEWGEGWEDGEGGWEGEGGDGRVGRGVEG